MSVLQQAQRALPGAEQRRRFESDGYLVIDTDIGADLRAAVIRELEPMYACSERPGAAIALGADHANGTRVQDAWRRSPAARQLATWPSILGFLAALYGRTMRPFQTLNFPIGTEQPAHADILHFDTLPSGGMCGVWVALEPIDAGNGPLQIYPGSHRLPRQTMRDAGAAPRERDYGRYEQHIARMVRREGLKPHSPTLEPGQAIVWQANLLHGGAPQQEPERSRHSQVTHYFAAGMRYHTPMRARGPLCYARNPRWIPARPEGRLDRWRYRRNRLRPWFLANRLPLALLRRWEARALARSPRRTSEP